MAEAKPARKSASKAAATATAKPPRQADAAAGAAEIQARTPEPPADPVTEQELPAEAFAEAEVVQAPQDPVQPVPEYVPMNADMPFAKPFESVAPAFEKAASDFVAQARAAQVQLSDKMQEMMEKNMKSVTEMSDFAKGNVEAMIESAKAAAAGAETLTTHFVETTKKAVEEAQAAFKTLSASKTPNEFIAAHNDYAKAQFDKAVANMSHLTETCLKLAGDVVQPLSNRIAVAAENVKKNMAA